MVKFGRALFNGALRLSHCEMLEAAGLEGVDLQSDGYVCAVIAPVHGVGDAEQYCRYCVDMPRIISRFFKARSIRALVEEDGAGRCQVLFLGRNVEDELGNWLEELKSNLQKKDFADVRIAVGQVVDTLPQVADSCNAAMMTLQYAGTDGQERILYSKNMQQLFSSFTFRKTADYDRVLQHFHAGSMDELRLLVTEYAEKIRAMSFVRSDDPYPTSIKRMFIELTVYVLHIASDAGVNVDALLGNIDPYTYLMSINGTPRIINWFMDVCAQMRAAIDERKRGKESRVVERVTDYIAEHLGEYDLSLETVSDAVGITPSYLSSLFGKEKGVGFSNYVCKTRIDAAIQLLVHSDVPVAQIAARVGFGSSNYFNRVFKKETGLPPGKYRAEKK